MCWLVLENCGFLDDDDGIRPKFEKDHEFVLFDNSKFRGGLEVALSENVKILTSPEFEWINYLMIMSEIFDHP